MKREVSSAAHAYQAADELLNLFGREKTIDTLRHGNWSSLDLDLPEPIEEYLIKNSMPISF